MRPLQFGRCAVAVAALAATVVVPAWSSASAAAAPASVPSCGPRALEASFGAITVTHGVASVVLVLTNTSGRSCLVSGVPVVRAVDERGQDLGAAASPTTAAPQRVLLVAGAAASSTMLVRDPNTFAAGTCRPTEAWGLSIVPPTTGAVANLLHRPGLACAAPGLVTALVSPLGAGRGLPPSPCTASQLSESFGQPMTTIATVFTPLVLTNASDITCTVRGFPSLALLGPTGRRLPTPVAHHTGGALRPIWVQPDGGQASTTVTFGQVSVFPVSSCHAAVVVAAKVAIAKRWLTPMFVATKACTARASVGISPLVPGAAGF